MLGLGVSSCVQGSFSGRIMMEFLYISFLSFDQIHSLAVKFIIAFLYAFFLSLQFTEIDLNIFNKNRNTHNGTLKMININMLQ